MGVLRLVVIANAHPSFRNIALRSPFTPEVIRYHLLKLKESGHIEINRDGMHALTQKGRKVLIEKGFL